MIRVLIFGAGGHAQVAADALLRAREAGERAEPVGYLDDNPELIGRTALGLPVLGSTSELDSVPHDGVFVAIGNNRVRAMLFTHLSDAGERLVNIIHPRAVLSPSVVLGRGILICAGAVVNTATDLGNNSIVNTGATIDHHCIIGAHCHIAPGAHLGGGVQVGDGTLLGIGAVVVPGRRVGRWSTIGAGAAVTRDIPDDVTAVGIPARIVNGHIQDRAVGEGDKNANPHVWAEHHE